MSCYKGVTIHSQNFVEEWMAAHLEYQGTRESFLTFSATSFPPTLIQMIGKHYEAGCFSKARKLLLDGTLITNFDAANSKCYGTMSMHWGTQKKEPESDLKASREQIPYLESSVAAWQGYCLRGWGNSVKQVWISDCVWQPCNPSWMTLACQPAMD